MAVPLVPEKPWYERNLETNLVVKVSKQQKEQLQEHADANEITISELVRFVLDYWTDRVEEGTDE